MCPKRVLELGQFIRPLVDDYVVRSHCIDKIDLLRVAVSDTQLARGEKSAYSSSATDAQAQWGRSATAIDSFIAGLRATLTSAEHGIKESAMTERFWQPGQQYSGPRMDPETAAADPFTQFRAWMNAAVEAKIANANAMTLATIDDRNRPAARIVLLKEIDDRGLTFYTNYHSRKGRDLESHGFAALVFYWDALHRQIRIEGAVEKVSRRVGRLLRGTTAR
jgi:Pyridoxamine 5'-phosphate oxidase